MTTLRGADMVRQYYPNTKMVGASIINLSRSDNKFDNFTVRKSPWAGPMPQQAVAQRECWRHRAAP